MPWPDGANDTNERDNSSYNTRMTRYQYIYCHPKVLDMVKTFNG